MTYPQPDPNQYAIGGQKFWRLNTTLISDGDIYESEQGAGGFAIGPDSDISKVNIAYYDDQVPGSFMNQVAITPQRPFPGTMYARNDAAYAPANRPGRFLIWPDELYNTDWRPSDYADNNYRIDFITPVLDVVEYFSPLGLNACRNDKEYQFQEWIFTNSNIGEPGGFGALVLPFYGRRFASIFLANPSTSQDYSISVFGLTYPMAAGALAQDTDLTQILASTLVGAGTNRMQLVKASVNGTFDALFIQIAGDVGTTTEFMLRILTSDREA